LIHLRLKFGTICGLDVRAKGLPEPANFTTHTTVRDPNEVFAFAFPDATGKLVSNTDARFSRSSRSISRSRNSRRI
jgi:hypothetical protein